MPTAMHAIEVDGTIDEQSRLQLDAPVPDLPPGRVRVIILAPEEREASEAEWSQSAARNSAFEFLNDPAEDTYTLADGKPYHG
jgi:hypothetical protein